MFLEFFMGKEELGGKCHVWEGGLIISSQNPSLIWW